MERSKKDLGALRSAEFVPTKPIELHEAVARAIAFNLRYRVAEIERDIADAELEKSNFEMLPALDVNAARDRNSVQISNTNDRIVSTANATFAWNVLDLGVSYARAKQKADEVLITQEQERKALQDIVRQVNTAFWRAAAGQRLLAKVHTIARDLQVGMDASREMERSKATDVISAVAFRRNIVESVKQALAIRRELQEAKTELAELLNIRPGTDFELALPAIKAGLPRLPMSVENLEVFALENRPELRVEKYNERVSDWQAREALYNLLPGLKISAGQNYSSDTNNLSPNWISTGVNMGMNLFQLFSGSSDVAIAENKAELARRQRLALSMAVLTQVHMSRIRFHSAAQQMRLAHEIAESDRKLTRLVRTDGQFLQNDFFEAVRLATQQLKSEMDEQRSYVDLVSARADLMHAIGLDVVPDTVPLDDVNALGDAVRAMMVTWNISDGTAPDPAAALPLDRLVNSMISAERRTDYLVSQEKRNTPADKPWRPTANLRAETLFTAGVARDVELSAALPDLPEPDLPQPNLPPPGLQASLPAPPPEEIPDYTGAMPVAQTEETTSAGRTGDVVALPEEERFDKAEPSEDIPAESIESLNEIAPSSGTNPEDARIGTPPRTEIAPAPPVAVQADADRNDRSRTAKRAAPAAGEQPRKPRPLSLIRPWVKLSRGSGWQFSIEPATSEPASGNGGQRETSSSSLNLQAGVTKLRDSIEMLIRAQRERGGDRGTIGRLNRIAPSSGGPPTAKPSHPTDWEFSVGAQR